MNVVGITIQKMEMDPALYPHRTDFEMVNQKPEVEPLAMEEHTENVNGPGNMLPNL